ncbi:unnamed protein product [Rotaria socialis]
MTSMSTLVVDSILDSTFNLTGPKTEVKNVGVPLFSHRFLPLPVSFNRSSHDVTMTEIESSSATITLFQRTQFHILLFIVKQTKANFMEIYARI